MKKSLFQKTVKVVMTSFLVFLLFISQGFVMEGQVAEEEAKTLSIEEFIRLATQNDTVFEEILIDEMKLQYSKDLNLPARDLVLEVKGQYDFMLNQDRGDPDMSVSLSKLFPYAGTEVEFSYANSPSLTSNTMKSQFNLEVSQPIAENAFGAATRLQDKIIGLEIDVIRHQIVEAYEDYLASLINTYYTWYSACENLKIGESSYKQNLQLLDNMNRRTENKIALPVDVNKVKLLVIDKEENVIALRETYKNITNLVMKAVRYEDATPLIPQDPSGFHDFEIDFEKGYTEFTQASRTYEILDLLENKSSLEVKKNADDLLPSTQLLFGYTVEGNAWQIKDEENMVYAGLSLEWPFPDQVDRAEYETSKIDYEKTQLTSQNTYLQIYTTLKNLNLQVQRERELIRLAQEKIRLSEEVLRDESRNYSFGKISLNDYIDAVNKVDTNNFSKIQHTVRLKQLLLEWLCLTDKLVDQTVLER